jgi:hypothetical protein
LTRAIKLVAYRKGIREEGVEGVEGVLRVLWVLRVLRGC